MKKELISELTSIVDRFESSGDKEVLAAVSILCTVLGCLYMGGVAIEPLLEDAKLRAVENRNAIVAQESMMPSKN